MHAGLRQGKAGERRQGNAWGGGKARHGRGKAMHEEAGGALLALSWGSPGAILALSWGSLDSGITTI